MTDDRKSIPGQRLHGTITPQPVPAEQAEEWRASRTPSAGLAHLFRFPFTIHVVSGLEPIVREHEGITWKLFPPFATRSDVPFREDIDLERVPRPPGSPVPGSDGLSVKATPHLGIQNASPANGIRLDSIPEADPREVERLLNRILDQLRSRTLQWWILRDDRVVDSYLKQKFRIFRDGAYDGPVTAIISYYVPLGFERPIDQRALELSLLEALSGVSPPLYYELFLDGVYHHCAEDYRRALLHLAMSCESGLDHFLTAVYSESRISKSRLKKIKNAKFEDRLDWGVNKIFGASFKEADQVSYDHLLNLWIARGHVAHGQEPLTRGEDGGVRLVVGTDVMSWIKATAKLNEWLLNRASR